MLCYNIDMIITANTIYPELYNILAQQHSILLLDNVSVLYEGIRNHADLQVCKIKDQCFISKEFQKNHSLLSISASNPFITINETLGNAYPKTARLNIVSSETHLICNTKHVAKAVLNFANACNMEIIHVKQAYTRCTTIPLEENAYITDDPGIAKALRNQRFDVLLVTRGRVLLPGHDYGFIGGTAGIIDDTIYFNGDLAYHPDGQAIKNYCHDHNHNTVEIKGQQLMDIGSILYI